MAIQSFDFASIRWRLFHKCIVCTNFDIYVLIAAVAALNEYHLATSGHCRLASRQHLPTFCIISPIILWFRDLHLDSIVWYKWLCDCTVTFLVRMSNHWCLCFIQIKFSNLPPFEDQKKKYKRTNINRQSTTQNNFDYRYFILKGSSLSISRSKSMYVAELALSVVSNFSSSIWST